MPNTNCLENIACPRCQSEEPFVIEMSGSFKVNDDGTEDMYDTDWGDDSEIVCCTCQHEGKVRDFRTDLQRVSVELAGRVEVMIEGNPEDPDAWCDAVALAFDRLTEDQITGAITMRGHELVPLSICDDCGAEIKVIVGCPDGAEICQGCFDKGAH